MGWSRIIVISMTFVENKNGVFQFSKFYLVYLE
jgi:hypothetical protein